MTSQSPRIYIYKITFEEVPYYYYGIHKEKRYNENYIGSPKTNKWCWKLYTPKKQILQLFDFTDDGWLEANQIEQRIIRPFYNDDKWCLNENCGGCISLDVNRKNGENTYKLKKGIFSRTPEQMRENGKKNGLKCKEHKSGVCGLTFEQRSKNGKKGTKRCEELGVGIYGLTPEQRSEIGTLGGKIGGKTAARKLNSQRWECLETGFITNPGALTRYQRKRNIDTSKRIRIS